MAQVCNIPPGTADDLPFADYLALATHCDTWLEIKKKVPQW